MKNSSSGTKYDKYFRTDHLKDNLKRRSVRGGAVTMLNQVLKFGLTMSSNVVLARLLTPQDYGLIGMLGTVTGLITLFRDLGLPAATLQKEEINHEQVSTLFWINVGLSVITALITVAIAPAIASFYNEPRLIGITLIFAVSFIINGLAVQHTALLYRQMEYKALMFIDVFCIFTGIVAAIVAALYGLGYWALVIMPILSGSVYTVGVWIVCGWRPGFPGKNAGVRSMLAFGGYLTASNFANYFAQNLDNVLIGKYWGTQQLGLYAKAYQLLMLPLTQINAPISGVATPSLSRLYSDPPQFRNYYLKALSLITFLTTPIIIFMIVTAKEIIKLLLGSQWLEAAVVFQLLGISAIFQPIYYTTGWLYMSTGRTERQFKFGGLISLLLVCSFFVGLPYGIRGVAFSYATAMLLLSGPAMYFAINKLPITLLDIFNSVKPAFVASFLAGAATFGVRTAISSNLPAFFVILACLLVMGGTYIITIFYVFRMKDFYLSILDNFKK